jgi:hypothetical protein
MRQEVLRPSLTRHGAVTLRWWVGDGLVPDRQAFLAEVRRHYWRAAARTPWPPRLALQLHLVFSALPGAAVYGALRDRGWDQEPAVEAVAKVIESRARRDRARLQPLARVRPLRAAFLPVAQLATEVGFPSPGWETRWRQLSNGVVAFDMTRCFLLDTFTRLGVPEITRAYCAADDVLYGDLCPQLRWLRKGTLATGAPVCDFRFERVEDRVAE